MHHFIRMDRPVQDFTFVALCLLGPCSLCLGVRLALHSLLILKLHIETFKFSCVRRSSLFLLWFKISKVHTSAPDPCVLACYAHAWLLQGWTILAESNAMCLILFLQVKDIWCSYLKNVVDLCQTIGLMV
jgi:hypothetical protein